jgi:hypothetical protein
MQSINATVLATGTAQWHQFALVESRPPMSIRQSSGTFTGTTNTTAAQGLNINYYDGGAAIPRTFTDGTSNTIIFSTKYALCGTLTVGRITNVTAVATSLPPKGAAPILVNSPSLANNIEGGSYYWAPPNSPAGAFFGSVGASTTAQAAVVTNNTNIPTFQLAPVQRDVNSTNAATAKGCNATPSRYSQSFGTGGLQVALGDASVRNITPSISVRTWNLAIQPNDGKVLGSDWNQ